MQEIFIGRQAIFDRNTRVYGYELLYREDKTATAPQLDGDRASSRVILNTFMEMGLARVAGPHRVFINLTRNFLVDLPPIPFDPQQVVLEILEDVSVDQQVVDSLRKLKAMGYTLALDDYEFQPVWDSVLPHIDIVKVEIPGLNWKSIDTQTQQLKARGLLLLAEKVEQESEYQRLHDLGFDYFQGYFFSRPYVISGQRLSENQLVTLRLLARINAPDITIEELETLIGQDPVLLFKILRYLNSAALSLPRKVDSIKQAVIYIGLQGLRAWATLMTLSGVQHKPQELFVTALVRAHTCIQLTRRTQPNEADTAFTAGLLSILDLLLDRPMPEILQQLPLSHAVQEAVVRHTGIAGLALRCALAFEDEGIEPPRFPGLNAAQLQEIYLDASEQAFSDHQALHNCCDGVDPT